jgi:hypothetical protein
VSDRPLTDTMERALIAIVDLARSDGDERRWHDHRRIVNPSLDVHGIREGTVAALETRGLIESDFSKYPREQFVRATDAGVALCDSMGD